MKTKPEQLYPTPKFFLTQSVFSINNVRISDRNWNCLKEKRGEKKKSKQTNRETLLRGQLDLLQRTKRDGCRKHEIR